jgi:hypothetical protein
MKVAIVLGSGWPLVPSRITRMQLREWSPKNSAPRYEEG